MLTAVAFIVAAAVAAAQDLSAPLPLDPSIRTGTLPNGLTYFIRPNPRPANRANLRLVVKAGSIDEADDQRGLAHMLEHMAFNGTTHFEPGELVSYLESIGARFGPHVNASTSFDETIYMLDVPTDRSGALSRGFEALGDFAGGIKLEAAEIDKERGVVLEEWRGRLGAGTRMQEPQIAALFGASKYASRIPIGTPENLKSFPHERLRDFYRDNYRPERMAVIVVGDIQVAEVEGFIRQNFSSIQRGAGERAVAQIPDHVETRYVSVSDPEQTASSVAMMIKRPHEPLETAGAYRRSLLRLLALQMLNARFAEISRQPNAPFLAAGAGSDTLGRTIEAATLSARVADGGIPQGLSGLALEISRLRQFGFGAAELDRATKAMVASYERSYNERDKAESPGLTNELIRHYLTKEAAPGIERELALVRQFLPTITAAEVGAVAREMFADGNRVVIATAPERAGLTRVTESALGDALRAGAAATVTAWRDEMATRELMVTKPTGGSIRSRREIQEIGVTVLTLSNGVEVWLKPTDFRNDEIVFSSYARGGVSLASPAEFNNASLSASLVGLAGVGGLTPVDMSKLLAGKTARAVSSIGTYAQGVSGSSSPRDLETALQLASLRFTSPNRDPAAFDLMRRQLETQLANQEQSPAFAYGERLGAINTVNHYTSRSLTLEDVKKLDPERMLQFYQQRFANAADFTFFFVGAFKVDEIAPLLATYLGALPSTGKAESKRGDLRIQFPASVVRERVIKGKEPSSQTTISFFANTNLEEMEDYRLSAATALLQARLRDILREEMGGTYSVSVGYGNTSPEPGYGTVSVAFGSAPENVERLTRAVMAEIDRLRRDGPSEADVNAVKQAEKNQIQTSLKQNNYWVNSLQAMHQLGRDARKIPQRLERADSLTPENVHESFRKYFPANRHTIITLVPETVPQSAPAAGSGAR
ncbi:MAG TPA: insulinase family protein [Vicinamibacterales bacterium]|nr:insulinase family protein [Vicinamibacterales bacterium]